MIKNATENRLNQISELLDHAMTNHDTESVLKFVEELTTIEKRREYKFSFVVYSNLASAYSYLYKESIENHDKYLKQCLCYCRKTIAFITHHKEHIIKDYSESYYNQLYNKGNVELANCIDDSKRSIYAIELYRNMVSNNTDSFSLCNLGLSYYRYALTLKKNCYKCALQMESRSVIEFGIELNKWGEYAAENSKEYFEGIVCSIPEIKCENKPSKNTPTGNAQEEKYFEWAINNHLMLSPINDIYETDRDINDDIYFSYICGIDKMEEVIFNLTAMFNEIKEMYISSRFDLYNCLNEPKIPSYAEKRTTLYNVGYNLISIRAERLKSIIITLYSILDKEAYLLNYIFELGVPLRNVYFKSIISKLCENTDYSKIPGVQGLLWIMEDIYGEDNAQNELLREMKELRNAIDHRPIMILDSSDENGCGDNLIYSIGEYHLIKLVNTLIRTIRESIIYLSIVISNMEEANCDGIIPKIYMDKMPYEYKV